MRNVEDRDDLEEKLDQKSSSLNYGRVIRKLMANKPFVAMIFALTVMYFVLCNIQFWISDYMVTEVGIDENTVVISFLVICITSPTVGVLISAIIPGKLNNDSTKIMRFILSVQFFLLILACMIPSLSNFWGLVISLWLFMCLGGCVMTMMLGM